MSMKKKVRFIDGFSESVWKSLAIKSLRVGWGNGVYEASKRLSPSTMKSMLVGGLFEDTFPAGYGELNEAIAEIDRKDYWLLCARDTHHGRGLSDPFCDLEEESVTEGRKQFYLMAEELKKMTSLTWVAPRMANCIYTWYAINPEDVERGRHVLQMEFKGMPECILDCHTYEGKRKGKEYAMLLLSGHYENHRKIGRIVQEKGWEYLRSIFKKDRIVEPKGGNQIYIF